MTKYLTLRARLSTSAVLMALCSCAAVSQEGAPAPMAPAASASTGTTTSAPTSARAAAAQTTIDFVQQNAGTPPADVNQTYLQLYLVPLGASESVTFEKNATFQQKVGEAWSKVRNYLVNTDETLAVTVKIKLAGADVGTRTLFVVDQGTTYGDQVLTPWFLGRDVGTMSVEAQARHTVSQSGHLFQTVVPVVEGVASVYAAGNVLVKGMSRVTGLDDKLKKVDEAYNKAFSKDDTKPLPNGYNDDPAKFGTWAVTLDGHPVAQVKVRFAQSIIARGNDAQAMPNAPSEILATKVNGTATGSIVEPFIGDFNKNTTPGFQAFCANAATALAGEGLNDVDRAAILWSQLSRSDWNRKVEMRPEGFDNCVAETKSLPRPRLDLASYDDLVGGVDADRHARVEHMRQGIFLKLPVIFSSPTMTSWDGMTAGGKVTFMAVQYDVQLGGHIFKAGKPEDMQTPTARAFLLKAAFKQDKARALKEGIIDDSCFSVQGTQTSSFSAYCFYPDAGKAGDPLKVQFDFAGKFPATDISKSHDVSNDPALIGVTFYPESDMVPPSATAPAAQAAPAASGPQ